MPTSPGSDEAPGGTVSAAETSSGVGQARGEATALLELREELARAQDRCRRALADLDNYRKRAEREGVRRAAEARHALLRDWLDAVDSVERALRMEVGDPGLTAVLAQMDAILSREGVVRMEPVGARFDPERHEVVAVLSTGDVPEHTVLEVARSGFGLRDGTVLRPAQVVVSRQPAGVG